MRIHPSVRQWVLAFLGVDALFWLLVLGSCALNPADCLATVTFPPYLYYFPAAKLLDVLPSVIPPLASLPFSGMIVLLAVLGAASHALVGALVGWLLRRTPVKPAVSFGVAAAVLVVTTFGFARSMQRAEIARETQTSLWAVETASLSMVSYHDATIAGADSPSTFELIVDEGTTTLYLENTDRTDVWLICNAPSCEDEASDGKVRMSYDEYVAVHDACAADPTTCPYYSIGILDLFDVTHDPLGIVSMRQVYTP